MQLSGQLIHDFHSTSEKIFPVRPTVAAQISHQTFTFAWHIWLVAWHPAAVSLRELFNRSRFVLAPEGSYNGFDSLGDFHS